MSDNLFDMLGDDAGEEAGLGGDSSAPTNSKGGIDGMLADNDDDDDLFGAPQQPEPVSMQSFEQPPDDHVEQSRAIVEWEREKQAEIQKLDADQQAADEKMRSEASAKLDEHYKVLRTSQENRAHHNLEVDDEFIRSQSDEGVSKWERVVSYIDFNRGDLHERDASRMKTLLLQLKH